MKSTAAIVLGIILVGMIAVTTIASAGYIGATTDSSRGTPSTGSWNGMMGGGMMGGSGYANSPCGQEYHQRNCFNNTYEEKNGAACPQMDDNNYCLNATTCPCMS